MDEEWTWVDVVVRVTLVVVAMVHLAHACGCSAPRFIPIPPPPPSCESQCQTDDTDTCTDGVCMCGSSPDCGVGFGCVNGRCLVRDPAGAACEFEGDCRIDETCIEGACSPKDCAPEVCNGIDDDCDGLADNVGAMPLSQYCLGDVAVSPWDEMPNAPCAIGVRVCEGGPWAACLGAVPPVVEQGLLACDGRDQDCDGCPDGVMVDGVCSHNDMPDVDVMFVMDVSGSMQGYIDAVRGAMLMLADRFSSASYRYGLIAVGTSNQRAWQWATDLTTIDNFRTELAGRRDSGADEPQREVVIGLGSGEIRAAWRTASRRVIIVFTDEEAQPHYISEQAVCDSLQHGESIVTVTVPEQAAGFDRCGLTQDLTTDAQSMASMLERAFEWGCDGN